MSARRAAVTGLGVICALGQNADQVWTAVSAGRCGIGRIQSVDISRLRFQNGAEIGGYDPTLHFQPQQAAVLDLFAQYGVIAAREALRDCGVALTPQLRERSAVITGSSMGGQCTQDAQFIELYRRDQNRVHPLTIPRTMANAAASQISLEFGITGPAFTLSTACSSAGHAIGQGLWMIRHGMADLVVAGGSEAPFSFGLLKAWEALRVVAPDTCRPFSKDRRGLILGEGAGMLVLESWDAAQARGARIYAELSGLGMSSDAHHLTQPSTEGPVRAMQAALGDAGWRAEQVGYINAHGTGTQANDAAEARAIRELFGESAGRLAVSSTKSLHGHALGAAGALEAVCTVLALYHGLIPPTANFTAADPECDLDVVPNQPRRTQIECALSNSFAFGGLNAVLAFQRA